MISVEEEGNKDQEHKDLYLFTLLQGLCLVFFQPVKSFTKKDHQDQLYTVHNSCNPQVTTAPSNKRPTSPYNSCLTNAEPTVLN